MRTTALIALTAAATLGLSACGGSEPLSQEQTSAGLLTEAEFPLDGFTAGEITEKEAGDEAPSASMLDSIPGVDELDPECKEAVAALDTLDADFSAQSTLDFTGAEGDSPFGAPTVSLVVASIEEGENPLDAVEALNSACEEITIEEEGMSMTMKFAEVEGDAQGSKISMDIMGETVEFVVAGREDGGNYTVVTGMGVEDAEIIEVLDAQEEKLADL